MKNDKGNGNHKMRVEYNGSNKSTERWVVINSVSRRKRHSAEAKLGMGVSGERAGQKNVLG